MSITSSPACASSGAPPPLFVREGGRGSPLVLLHGLASSSAYWEPHLATLERTYRVIAPDLMGFGRSPKPERAGYTPAEHLAAVTTALEPRLDGPVTLVGHSMGAMLALHLAVSRPDLVNRLLLVSLPAVGDCAWGHHPDGGHARFHHFSVHTTAGRAVFNACLRGLQPLWSVLGPPLRPDVPRGATRDALRASWTSYWRTLEEVVFGSDVSGMFERVSGPVTVIHGRCDSIVPVAPVRDLARTRADARYIEIPDAAHNPCFSHPSVFHAALFDDLDAGSAPARPAMRLQRLVVDQALSMLRKD